MLSSKFIVSAMFESEDDAQTRTVGLFHIPGITSKGGLFFSEQPEANSGQGKDIWRVLIDWVRLKSGVEVDSVVSDRYSSAQAAEAANSLVADYRMVAVLRDFEGICHLFSRNRRVKLPDEFLSRVKSLLNIYPTTQLQWHPQTEYDTGDPIGADQAIFGMPSMDKLEPKKPAKKAGRPGKHQLDFKKLPPYLRPGQAGLSDEEWRQLIEK